MVKNFTPIKRFFGADKNAYFDSFVDELDDRGYSNVRGWPIFKSTRRLIGTGLLGDPSNIIQGQKYLEFIGFDEARDDLQYLEFYTPYTSGGIDSSPV